MIAVFIVVLVAGILLYAVVATGSRNTKQRGGKSKRYDREFVAHRWNEIESMTATGAGARSAVTEADKLFDYVLKGMGFAGNTMAERLKLAERRLSNRNAVWQAHKLRNALAHEVGFEITPSHAREALGSYKRALHDLGAL